MRAIHSYEHVLITLLNFSWVSLGWISEFTIMILVVEVLLDGLTNSNEVVDVLQVGDVGVEVILEVLKHVHVLLNLIVSSNSGEGEGGIHELPGFDLRWLDLKLISDFHGILVVLNVEVS